MGSGFKARISNAFVRIARRLVRVGELAAAAMAARVAVRLCRDDTEAYVIQSAVARASGDHAGARELLDRGIRIHPYVFAPCNGAPTATLLKVRGVDNGYYTLGRRPNNDRTIKLRGGNTSDEYLTDRSKFSVINFFVRDGNLRDDQNLPPFDLVLNMISDPDVELEALNTLAAFLRSHDAYPVINRPERVIETTRDGNYRRFGGLDGVLFPATLRLNADGIDGPTVEQAMAAAGIDYPCLIRATGSHTGRSLSRLETRADLDRYLRRSTAPELYVIAYQDNDILGNLFGKMRMFAVDGAVFPVVCHIDAHWNVHGGNRRRVMAADPRLIEEERAFIADPEGYLGDRPYRAVREMLDRAGLDFCGIDFTVLGDGRVLVFELNPAMRHSFDHARDFPYLDEPLHAITAAFNRMIVRKIETARAGVADVGINGGATPSR